jgi:hypothetical protein
MSARRQSTPLRGQNLVVMALSLLLVTLMAMMTLSITSRVRQKLELQTVADVAAYNDAVSTARGLNTIGLLNRAIVSHWVVMLGIQANVAFASQVPAMFDTFAFELDDMRTRKNDGSSPVCANRLQEAQRISELLEARNAFMHASFSLWTKAGPMDIVNVPGCAGCFTRVTPGLGQLDADVADEVKTVRSAVRDLVEVQRDLNTQLLETLKQQSGAKQVAAAALGTPFASSTFPYTVQRGAAAAGTAGATMPPGAREVVAAMSTSREALNPLAHAAMGSRGNMFVISGMVEASAHGGPGGLPQFGSYTPDRARQYTDEIRDTMNARFPASHINFHVAGGMMVSFMNDGSNEDDTIYTHDPAYLGPDQPTETVAPESSGPVATGVADTEPPQNYQPDQVWRMSPSRSIGLDYVGAKAVGSVTIHFRGPCGDDRRDLNSVSYARTHANGDQFMWSNHGWELGDKLFTGGAADGAHTYAVHDKVILHGAVAGTTGDVAGIQGWDKNGHPFRFLCHNTHAHTAELHDLDHGAGPPIDGMGVMPGGFGFIFPQGAAGADGAGGAFGQPKLPVLMTRASSGGGLTADPWNLKLNLKLSPSSGGATLDMLKDADAPMAAIGTGLAYYHRRCAAWRGKPPGGQPDGTDAYCVSWMEPPNLLNPFWHATLAPIDVDEHMPVQGDHTPGSRYVNEAALMLTNSSLPDAAAAYRALKTKGYEGFQ